MLSAVKPTNRPTLGNYLGALNNWRQLQYEYDCLFFAVDLHSITVKHDPKELRENTYLAIATYLACGIDPKHCLLFAQSHVPQHAELSWLLTCFTYMGELSRMTQYKDKSARAGQNIGAGLFCYPALMASDILLYQTDVVPVGEDQKQHIELTRDLAIRLNNQFGKDLFTVPKPYIGKEGARIMDLQNPEQKMGKTESTENGIVFLSDTDKDITNKVKRAVTDSGSEITESEEKIGVWNLLQIQSVILKKPIVEIVAGYAGKQYGHLKVDTAAILVEAIRPIREETARLMGDKPYLDGILHSGAERARERAAKTLGVIYEKVGFLPRR